MLTCTGTPSIFCSSAFSVLDVLALLADHHARTRRVDGDARVLGRTLDQDAPTEARAQLLAQVLADLQVFGQHAAKFGWWRTSANSSCA
jgi:hypothetical protein